MCGGARYRRENWQQLPELRSGLLEVECDPTRARSSHSGSNSDSDDEARRCTHARTLRLCPSSLQRAFNARRRSPALQGGLGRGAGAAPPVERAPSGGAGVRGSRRPVLRGGGPGGGPLGAAGRPGGPPRCCPLWPRHFLPPGAPAVPSLHGGTQQMSLVHDGTQRMSLVNDGTQLMSLVQDGAQRTSLVHGPVQSLPSRQHHISMFLQAAIK